MLKQYYEVKINITTVNHVNNYYTRIRIFQIHGACYGRYSGQVYIYAPNDDGTLGSGIPIK